MKKTFVYLISFVAVLCMTACSDVLDEPSNEVVNSEKSSYDLAVKLLDSFKNSVSRSLDDDLVYPDYYGGMYIDEFGDLNVLVKDGVSSTRSVVTNIIDSENVVLHPCLYSYSELL